MKKHKRSNVPMECWPLVPAVSVGKLITNIADRFLEDPDWQYNYHITITPRPAPLRQETTHYFKVEVWAE